MARSDARPAPRALVLAAGLGTRLRPLTARHAKGAVPVNGEPLVRRILRWLAAHGISEAVVNLHYRPASIAAVLGDGSDLGVRIRYSWEQPVLGSAGGPRHALPLLLDGRRDPFLIVNGDTLTDFDPAALAAHHAASGARVTMALIPNPDPARYGGVLLSPDGYVSGFTRRGMAGPSFHFVGVQMSDPETFAELPDGVPWESVGQLYPALMASDPRSVAGWVSDASFEDIGTPRDYLETSLALAAREGDRLRSPRGTLVDPSARIDRSVLWDDVVVGAGASLTRCIVADGVRIPPGAEYADAVLVRDETATPEGTPRVTPL